MSDQPDHPDDPASDDNPPKPVILDVDPALYPPDTRSPEEIAFWEDLKAYDNPEIFGSDDPQVYKLRIVSTHFADYPTVLSIELDGDVLPYSIRETLFALIKQYGNMDELIKEDYGSFAEMRSEMLADSEYLALERDANLFFIRHFPKLTQNIFNILSVLSASAAISTFFEDSKTRDEALKNILEGLLREMRRSIKSMLQTRKTGRHPKKKEDFPEIVRRVMLTARGMMGSARGKSNVPVLKEIARNLDTNDDALGLQLRRVGFPWTSLKTFLEKLPPDNPT